MHCGDCYSQSHYPRWTADDFNHPDDGDKSRSEQRRGLKAHPKHLTCPLRHLLVSFTNTLSSKLVRGLIVTAMVAVDAGFNKPSTIDERGWLWFVCILAIIYSLSFYAARIFGKYGFLWWDDLVLGIGYVSTTPYVILNRPLLIMHVARCVCSLGNGDESNRAGTWHQRSSVQRSVNRADRPSKTVHSNSAKHDR